MGLVDAPGDVFCVILGLLADARICTSSKLRSLFLSLLVVESPLGLTVVLVSTGAFLKRWVFADASRHLLASVECRHEALQKSSHMSVTYLYTENLLFAECPQVDRQNKPFADMVLCTGTHSVWNVLIKTFRMFQISAVSP